MEVYGYKSSILTIKLLFISIITIFPFILNSCVSSRVTPYPNAIYSPTSAQSVNIYYMKPPIPFEAIGEVEVQGAPLAEWSSVETRMKQEAAKIGGDAVILLSKENPFIGALETPTYVYAGQNYFYVQPGDRLELYAKYLFGIVIKWKLDDTETKPAHETERNFGLLNIISIPREVFVFHKYQFIGLTPIQDLRLEPGTYNLLFEKSGYLSAIQSITIYAGSPQSLTIELVKE